MSLASELNILQRILSKLKMNLFLYLFVFLIFNLELIYIYLKYLFFLIENFLFQLFFYLWPQT